MGVIKNPFGERFAKIMLSDLKQPTLCSELNSACLNKHTIYIVNLTKLKRQLSIKATFIAGNQLHTSGHTPCARQ